jgi:nucleotide-binding universal stress UspA family protein
MLSSLRHHGTRRFVERTASMFRKALLPLDRSEFSEAAIPHVADVTTQEAVVIGVVESVGNVLVRSGGPAVDVPADVAERIRESEQIAVQRQLDQAALALRDAGIEKVSTIVREGRAGSEIVEAAEKLACDVVVMSTHGRTGIRRALLGSVANYVVHNAEGRAVLLIRPPAE